MAKQWSFVVSVVFGMALPVFAQDDVPGRGVARISLLAGEVSIKRGDSGDLLAAALNAPLVTQDRISTDGGSRAEVQFDHANMIRLAPNAEVRFAELEYKKYLIQVAKGTITFRVLRDQDADVEVSTPSVSVRPVKRGIYRITVQEDGTSEITVRSGEAEIFTPQGTERLKSGRTMFARGTVASPEFRTSGALAEDDWDRWNERRDRDLDRSRSYTYVSRDVYGAEDLDDHGRWMYTPDYGYVWAPRVAAGWAPYRYGRWTWIDWYGWSWLSYDPWGWAPYHYGRWYWNTGHGGWCWWPGGIGTRHYWRPALVAFFGLGSLGVGFGTGSIGWVPLGPREPFYPWYGSGFYGGYRGRGYGGNGIRIVNNINITNVYRNSRVVNGITAIDHGGFSRGRSGNSISWNHSAFRDAGVVQGHLPITPGRESLRFADRDLRTPGGSSREPERFYSRRAPSPGERVSFDDQRRGVEQMVRRGFDDGRRAANAAPGGPERGQGAASSAPSSGGGRDGWRRIGERSTGEAGVSAGVERPFGLESSGSQRGSGDGWRRFGSARAAQPDSQMDRSGRFGEPAESRGLQSGRGIPGPQGLPAAEGLRTIDSTRGGNPASNPGVESSDGWRRFGSGRRSERGDTGGSVAPALPGGAVNFGSRESAPASSDPRGGRSEGRGDWVRTTPRFEGRQGERSGDSVRISPPIVRERAGESGEGGSRGNFSRGFDSGMRLNRGGDLGRGGGDGSARGAAGPVGRSGDGGGFRGGGQSGGSRGGRGR